MTSRYVKSNCSIRFEYDGTVPLELFNIKNVNAAGEEDRSQSTRSHFWQIFINSFSHISRSAILGVYVNDKQLCGGDGGDGGDGAFTNVSYCHRGCCCVFLKFCNIFFGIGNDPPLFQKFIVFNGSFWQNYRKNLQHTCIFLSEMTPPPPWKFSES